MKNGKRKNRKAILISSFAVLLTLAAWVYWGNTFIQTTYISVSSYEIPAAFDGYTIVQVSDLHNAEFGDGQTILLNKVKNASPDIIAVTGDLIDSNHTSIAKAMDFINGAVKIAPVYYVTGNHEAWSAEYEELKKQMVRAGVDILEDENTIIEHAGAAIRLLGLNDPDFTATGNAYGRAVMIDGKLKDIMGESNEYVILLSHRPELLDVYADNSIDLVLSGHAHGGQVRLPFLGGMIAPDQGFFPQYFEGLHEKNGTKMVVSRGLGNSIIPIRINNRPEVVVITLES